MKPRYGNPNNSTLIIIERHIFNLEFNYMVVGASKALLIELGTAYKTKMEIIMRMRNESANHTEFSEKNYPSKLNKETSTSTDAKTD